MASKLVSLQSNVVFVGQTSAREPSHSDGSTRRVVLNAFDVGLDTVAIQIRLSTCHPHVSSQHLERGRLSGTVNTKQPEALALLYTLKWRTATSKCLQMFKDRSRDLEAVYFEFG